MPKVPGWKAKLGFRARYLGTRVCVRYCQSLGIKSFEERIKYVARANVLLKQMYMVYLKVFNNRDGRLYSPQMLGWTSVENSLGRLMIGISLSGLVWVCHLGPFEPCHIEGPGSCFQWTQAGNVFATAIGLCPLSSSRWKLKACSVPWLSPWNEPSFKTELQLSS